MLQHQRQRIKFISQSQERDMTFLDAVKIRLETDKKSGFRAAFLVSM